MISKWEVWRAWQKVAANKGAAGVGRGDPRGVRVAIWRDNLYKIWNRMSSGMLLSAPGEGGGDPEGRMAREPGCSAFPRSATG